MEFLIMVILTLLNGFFALSEVSIISVRKHRIRQKARAGNKSAQAVLDLLEEPEDFLSAVQVGITLIGIVLGVYGGTTLSGDMQVVLQRVPWLAPYAETLSIVLVVSLITYFSMVLGELIPKTIALGNSERIALLVAPIIKVFTRMALPLVKVLSGSTSLVVRLLGVKAPQEEKLSEEDLRHLIATAGRQGVLAQEETDLHQNIFHYSEQKAKHLKTHRREVEWVSLQDSEEQIKEKLRESGHSKFPVFDRLQDRVVGILNAKEFYENLLGQHVPLTALIHDPIFVPETMYASVVLNLFKKHKQYLGVVVDEFGSVEGIITLHDILEAIVGDMPDPDEVEEPEFIQRDQSSFLVSGMLPVEELNEKLKHDFIQKDPAEYVTLAGFVLHRLGRIPVTGEKLEHNGFEIEVVDMDGTKIDKLLLKEMLPAPDPGLDLISQKQP
ncbi:hypothetical protein TH63_12415 [Rufibacter radiotolerans]|uniref:Hemolysin n=1 Tax=Rufibacter radiotolerans TaxID=1379910 RepID=A0A0H4W736_9BACT|nr:hemolysin family protein [Rufibacter radiotolerans]AKQ46241.1 hypothetical protein TH63_12415 [Rufibacter radiotolerans]